jgi:hypothetical protein
MVDENVTAVPPQPSAATPPPPTVSEPVVRLDYKPISSWAVAGLIAGSAVTALVLLGVVLSLLSDDPTFLPLWLIVTMSSGGALVSFIAMRLIVSSEGTRTGMGLARWGLWLSILSGLGYLVWALATDFALQSQANAFLKEISPDDAGKTVPDTGFFPRLLASTSDRDAAFYSAFLLTVVERAGSNPNDETSMQTYNVSKDPKSPARLAQFRDNGLVRFIRDMAAVIDKEKIHIEPMGVKSCTFVSPKGGKGRGHWEVVRSYKVATPEIVRVYTLDVRSIEPSGPNERRKWYLALPQEQVQAGYRTPLGDGLKSLRAHVHVALTKWNGDNSQKLAPLDKTDFANILPEKKLRESVQNGLLDFDTTQKKLELVPFTSLEFTPWRQQANGRIQMDYPIVTVTPPVDLQPPVRLDGHVTVESNVLVDPATFTSASPDPGWTVQSLKWHRATPYEIKKK